MNILRIIKVLALVVLGINIAGHKAFAQDSKNNLEAFCRAVELGDHQVVTSMLDNKHVLEDLLASKGKDNLNRFFVRVACNGYPKLVEIMLNNKRVLEVLLATKGKDSLNEAFYLAAHNGNHQIVTLMLKNQQVLENLLAYLGDYNINRAFYWAARNFHFEVVEAMLIKEGGIAPKRITTIGYGETRPAAFEPYCELIDSKAAHENMRVLFEIIVK